MQKFGRTIPRECRGSIIYDKVVLWDVHEVFLFLSNHALVINYYAWVLADRCTKKKLYIKAVKNHIKTHESENLLCRYTHHGAEKAIHKSYKIHHKNPIVTP